MMAGVEGVLKIGRETLQLRYFWALGARVVASAIWLVADVLKLTVGAAAGTTVEVAADGCLLELLSACWLGGVVGKGVKRVGQGSGGGCWEGTKGLSGL